MYTTEKSPLKREFRMVRFMQCVKRSALEQGRAILSSCFRHEWRPCVRQALLQSEYHVPLES